MDRGSRRRSTTARLATLGAVLRVVTYALDVVVEAHAARAASDRHSCR
jgi:hypothetical protein